MNEIENIKTELISLYNSIKKDLSEESFSSLEQSFEDISKNISVISLIKKIKEALKNNLKYVELYKELLNNYHQLENQIRKNEYDIRYYISQLMALEIKIISLKLKLNAYRIIEDELEELKAKLKYEDGKFLENDRKDNEILILRKENSKIKNQLTFYELKNEKFEEKKIKYKNIIYEMEHEIKSLNKKINELETKIKQSENKTRNVRINNIAVHSSTSKHDSKAKTRNFDNFIHKFDNPKYNTIKNIRYRNNSDMKYICNIYSPNSEYYLFENHHNKSTILSKHNKIFDLTYNNFFKKKIKFPLKKDLSSFMKKRKSDSLSRILNYESDGFKNILNKSYKKRKNLVNTGKAGNKKKFLIKSLKM